MVAIKDVIGLPEPLAAKLIDVVVLVQLNTVPVTVPLKVTGVVDVL